MVHRDLKSVSNIMLLQGDAHGWPSRIMEAIFGRFVLILKHQCRWCILEIVYTSRDKIKPVLGLTRQHCSYITMLLQNVSMCSVVLPHPSNPTTFFDTPERRITSLCESLASSNQINPYISSLWRRLRTCVFATICFRVQSV